MMWKTPLFTGKYIYHQVYKTPKLTFLGLAVYRTHHNALWKIHKQKSTTVMQIPPPLSLLHPEGYIDLSQSYLKTNIEVVLTVALGRELKLFLLNPNR